MTPDFQSGEDGFDPRTLYMENNRWQKSSYCGTNACVEVSEWDENANLIAVRNSVAPKAKVLFSYDEWITFIQGVKNNEFDI